VAHNATPVADNAPFEDKVGHVDEILHKTKKTSCERVPAVCLWRRGAGPQKEQEPPSEAIHSQQKHHLGLSTSKWVVPRPQLKAHLTLISGNYHSK
jgi:hypothetical protein